MNKKNFVMSSIAAVLALAVALSAWGFVGAQDNAPRPFLGIALEPSDKGALVTQVVADSPAQQAGLQVGDIIQKIDDHEVTTATIQTVLQDYAVGDTIKLSILRGTDTLELSATLVERPTMDQPSQQPMSDRPALGIRLEDTDNGVTIREVLPGSAAEKAGLKADDIIVKLGDTEITSAQQAVEAVRALAVGDTLTIEVKRGDENVTVTATLESMVPNVPNMQTMPGDAGIGIAYNGTDQTWTIQALSDSNPLYEAGLRQGDVITQFDGKAYDPAGLQNYLKELKDKNTENISVTVQRGSDTEDISVPLSALDSLAAFGMGFGPDGMNFGGLPFEFGGTVDRGHLGVEFITLDDTTAQEHNVPQTEGALITGVTADSPAAKAGLEMNDIVTAVDSEPVDQEHTLRDRLFAYESGDTITLDVTRGDQTMQLDVTLDQTQIDNFPFFGEQGVPFFGQTAPQPAQPQTTPNL